MSPIEAGTLRIVDEKMRMRSQQPTVGRESVAKLRADSGELRFFLQVIQDLRADDQVHAAGDRPIEEIDLAEFDVLVIPAAFTSSRQCPFRDVRGDQPFHPWRKRGGEEPFCAGELEGAVGGLIP
jgi:hypothetical protein